MSNQPPYGQPPYDPQYPPSGGYPPSQGGYPPQQGGYYPAPDAYQQAQPYGYPGVPVAQPQKGGGFAIAGLILGIVSIPIAIFAICGYITAILGLVFSIIALRVSSRRTMATIGAHDGDNWPGALDHRLYRLDRQLGCRRDAHVEPALAIVCWQTTRPRREAFFTTWAVLRCHDSDTRPPEVVAVSPSRTRAEHQAACLPLHPLAAYS